VDANDVFSDCESVVAEPHDVGLTCGGGVLRLAR